MEKAKPSFYNPKPKKVQNQTTVPNGRRQKKKPGSAFKGRQPAVPLWGDLQSFRAFYFASNPCLRAAQAAIFESSDLSKRARHLVSFDSNQDLTSAFKVMPHCPHRFKHICKDKHTASAEFNAAAPHCSKIHFQYQTYPHTEFTLGDCHYLDTCRHTDTCKYVHYQIDPTDLHKNLHQLTKQTKFFSEGQSGTPSISGKRSSGWVRSETLDLGIIKDDHIARLKDGNSAQWINCNFEQFDLRSLVDQPDLLLTEEAAFCSGADGNEKDRILGEVAGDYEVLMVDPPWDIQMNLPYNTVADTRILEWLDGIEELQSPGGLIFFWVTNRTTELGIEWLQKWGYSVVEEICWVKVNQLGRLIRTGPTGHFLNHTKEHCLVGVKLAGVGSAVSDDFLHKFEAQVVPDVIVSEVRETSRKPEEIYSIIDILLGERKAEAKKLELFARENNLRDGWLSIGNQVPKTHLVDGRVISRVRNYSKD